MAYAGTEGSRLGAYHTPHGFSRVDLDRHVAKKSYITINMEQLVLTIRRVIGMVSATNAVCHLYDED